MLRSPRPMNSRSGITLVETLVSVALLVLMMSVIVRIFQEATGSVTSAKTYQELDNALRQLDSTLRTDLANVTARLTPPLDPKDNLGYFEYGENSFADLQGEDADDYIRFTTKAPEGQPFTGRFYPPPSKPNTIYSMATTPGQKLLGNYMGSMPITVQSQYAEVIYFLRNGNLYRRVLLVAPELQSRVNQLGSQMSQLASSLPTMYSLPAGVFGGLASQASLSWQGLNDLSAHPSPTGNMLTNTIVLNTLGDLTNRENRFGYSRFANDFWTAGSTPVRFPDNIPDDLNQDTVPDYYPSLYPNVFNVTGLINEVWLNGQATNPRTPVLTTDAMAFPFTFPVAYSRPDPTSATYGSIHTPDPSLDPTTLAGLQALNHSPLDIGDSLPRPGSLAATASTTHTSTWWGFPTWRETLSPNWTDPYFPVQERSGNPGQPPCLSPVGLSQYNALPPMDSSNLPGTGTTAKNPLVPFRLVPQFNADPFDTSQKTFIGGSTFLANTSPATSTLWKTSWEDDLIATGVRSFDVKAYDNSYPGYVDLGWGDDIRITSPAKVTALQFNPTGSNTVPVPTPIGTGGFAWGSGVWDTYNQTFAHEGRMPPLVADLRVDALNPTFGGQYRNIGDNQSGLTRLRRVFDTWSTDYSRSCPG